MTKESSIYKSYWKSIYSEAWKRVNGKWNFQKKIVTSAISLVVNILMFLPGNIANWKSETGNILLGTVLFFIAFAIALVFYEAGQISPERDKNLSDEIFEYTSPKNILLKDSEDEKPFDHVKHKSFQIINMTGENISGCYVSVEEIRNRVGDPLRIKLPIRLGWSGGGNREENIPRGDRKNFDIVKVVGSNSKIYITSQDKGDLALQEPGTYYFDIAIGGGINNRSFRRKRALIRIDYTGGIDVMGKIVKFDDEEISMPNPA